MDRRQFLKISTAMAAIAAAGYCGTDIVRLASQSALAAQRLRVSQNAVSLGAATGTAALAPTGPMDGALRIPHLLRRAGFGASPQELAVYQGMGFDGAVQRLLNYDQVENPSLPPPNIALAYSGRPIGDELSTLGGWWIDRMVQTARPLEEKMTLFWHNHFATGYSKVLSGYLMYKQNQFLRSNALGSFRDILAGMTSDGAMLIWLDGNSNAKGNPNENYAREVMEVFTTGRGPYTQTDVEEAARAFTGYSIDANGDGLFIPSQHDDGIKTFLGATANFDPSDITDILVSRPETASSLSTELFEFFAYPNPSEETIGKLSDVYFRSNYSLRALVEAILTSEEFVSERAYLANVKSPVEYVATALRSLGATASVADVAATLNNQGQTLFDPPSVFGWPSGSYWINTGSMIERFNFPLNIQTGQQTGMGGPDPATATGATIDTTVESISGALFPDGLPSEILELIRGSTAGTSDPDLRTMNALRLVMSTPFYNLN